MSDDGSNGNWSLETRAESMNVFTLGNAVREGELDSVQIGDSAAYDAVYGAETATIRGKLRERNEGDVSHIATRLETTIGGRMTIRSGFEDTMMIGGPVTDTWTGATLIGAAMSDDLCAGAGARVTAPVDLWLNNLTGMEERPGTAAADAVFLEGCGTLFEREYGSSVYAVGATIWTGTTYVTTKTGFRPLMRVAMGVRNLVPGSGTAAEEQAPPAPPPGPSGAEGGLVAGGMVTGSAGVARSTVNVSVSVDSLTDAARAGEAGANTVSAQNAVQLDGLKLDLVENLTARSIELDVLTDTGRVEDASDLRHGESLATDLDDLRLSANLDETIASEAMLDVTEWTKIGPRAGSNPGGLLVDPDGTKWYVKWPRTTDHAANEQLAAKFYQKLGVDVPEIRLATDSSGKVGVASRIIDGLENVGPNIKYADGTHDGLVADAWLANWDVVGLTYDNLLMKDGKAYRIDTGGALNYRAQGSPKGSMFGNTVGELDSIPKRRAAVFGDVDDATLRKGAYQVLALTDEDISKIVAKYGPGTAAEQNALAGKLMARRDDIAKRILFDTGLEKLDTGDWFNVSGEMDAIAGRIGLEDPTGARPRAGSQDSVLSLDSGLPGSTPPEQRVLGPGDDARLQDLDDARLQDLDDTRLQDLRAQFAGTIEPGEGSYLPIEARVEGMLQAYDSLVANGHPVGQVLTAEEYIALKGYTQKHFMSINDTLRSPGTADPRWLDTAKLAEQALNKMDDAGLVSEDKFYRGLNAKRIPDDIEGRTLVDKGFLSASKDPLVGDDYAMRKNQPATEMLFGRGVVIDESISEIGWEKEVLFRPGTEFNVLFRHDAPPDDMWFRGRTRLVMADSALPPTHGTTGLGNALVDFTPTAGKVGDSGMSAFDALDLMRDSTRVTPDEDFTGYIENLRREQLIKALDENVNTLEVVDILETRITTLQDAMDVDPSLVNDATLSKLKDYNTAVVLIKNGDDPSLLLRDAEVVEDVKGLLSRHATSAGGNPYPAGVGGSVSPGVGRGGANVDPYAHLDTPGFRLFDPDIDDYRHLVDIEFSADNLTDATRGGGGQGDFMVGAVDELEDGSHLNSVDDTVVTPSPARMVPDERLDGQWPDRNWIERGYIDHPVEPEVRYEHLLGMDNPPEQMNIAPPRAAPDIPEDYDFELTRLEFNSRLETEFGTNTVPDTIQVPGTAEMNAARDYVDGMILIRAQTLPPKWVAGLRLSVDELKLFSNDSLFAYRKMTEMEASARRFDDIAKVDSLRDVLNDIDVQSYSAYQKATENADALRDAALNSRLPETVDEVALLDALDDKIQRAGAEADEMFLGGANMLDPAVNERLHILKDKVNLYWTVREAICAGKDPVLYLEEWVRFAEDASDVSRAQFAAILETQAELMQTFTDPRLGFPVDVDGLRSGLGVDDFDTSSSSSLEFRLRQLDRDSSDLFDELGPLPPMQEDSSVFDELGPLSPILEDPSGTDELDPLPPKRPP